jgi:hypothetical protein
VNAPISLDENTGTTWFQPDEDLPGVLEILTNPFDEEKFAKHQTRRLQQMAPSIPHAQVLAAVERAMSEDKKFTRELLLELRNTLLSIQEN